MGLKDIYNSYENGLINEAEFRKLVSLYGDSKYTDEEAIEKENKYFKRFKNICDTLSANEEKARILFEIMVVYTEISNAKEVSEETINKLTSIYHLLKTTSDSSEVINEVCTMSKNILVNECANYKIKTAFTLTNKEVFNEILSKINTRNSENDRELRGPSR